MNIPFLKKGKDGGKGAVRTYTEKLEKIISDGIELRDKMRLKNESLQRIIEKQASEITQLRDEVHSLTKQNENAKKLAAEAAKQRKKASKNPPATVKTIIRTDDDDFKKALKEWVRAHNGGVLPDELKYTKKTERNGDESIIG